jgi:hypothetical protein
MFMPCHHDAGQNRNVKLANKFFREPGKFKIFGDGSKKSKRHL